eukprot:CAMPEP_0174713360 /NCGR_PEP_ID=MMETSP1094-20130205/14056_1 /TAXON_ID=156173 /ORGANISM="Chrysochromulina brevifilum, Strain UTEX LB 985" /LENGTH=471 /DNA_ID=CAMNT_0015912537 /DNA_START=1 /DNA_END=1416 /DNA_ORIENTATION=+
MAQGSDWVRICRSRDVGTSPVHYTLCNDNDIVLVRHGGRLLAMSNRCPHKQARLHRSGDIEDLGGDLGLCLRCPKHRSKFGGGLFVSFETGKCSTHSRCSRSDRVEQWSVPVYDAKEVEKEVWVRPRPAAGPPKGETGRAATGPRLAAQLAHVQQVSPDSYEFTMQISKEADRAAFASEPAAMWHVCLHLADVSREYTPLSSASQTAQTGSIRLLIKLYEHGRMSRALAAAQVGERVAVSAPRPTLRVPGLEVAPKAALRGLSFNLVAGGTGIAPCLQLARRARDAAAAMRLIYSVRTRADVLLADEIEQLASQGSFSYTLVLSQEATATEAATAAEEAAEAEVETVMAEAPTAARFGKEPCSKRPRALEPSAAVTGRALHGRVVCGRYIGSSTVQEQLLGVAELGKGLRVVGKGCDGSRKDGLGGAVVKADGSTPLLTIICGPPEFNEHCEGLVRRMVQAKEHVVAVLDA